jgi:hypothetical protein
MKIEGSNTDPNPDPLVRGMDPRIRIWIHTKMSWIRNTFAVGSVSSSKVRSTLYHNICDLPGGEGFIRSAISCQHQHVLQQHRQEVQPR